MAKRDFDAFYYGVGMKLDEKSVEQAGQMLEGRLNQVVDNVTKEVKKIALAVNSGVKDIDTTGLNKAIKEVGMDLDDLVDFDPKKLKAQIGDLQKDFGSLESKIDGLADSVRDSFKGVNKLIDGIGTRLGQIEIRVPQKGLDAFKTDLELMAKTTQRMLDMGEIDTEELDKYLQKIKNGFASLKASGNSLDFFADKDVAKYLVNISNMLRDMGTPADDLRTELFEISSVFKSVFEDTEINGKGMFKSVGYQIEETNHKLKQARLNITSYNAEIAKLQNEMRDWHQIADSDDQVLIDEFQKKQTVENLEAIIAKIEEYQTAIFKAPKDSPDLQSYEKLIALSQTAEGILSRMGSRKAKPLLSVWAEQLSGVDDLTDYKLNEFSTGFLEDYRGVLQTIIDGIQDSPKYKELSQTIGEQTLKLEELMSKAPAKRSSAKKGTDLAKATGEQFVVSPEIKIDTKKWAEQISKALTEISDPEKGKLKPINIRINTQKTQLEKDLNQIWTAIENTLKGTRKASKKDADGNPVSVYETAFDTSFKSFMKKLSDAKTQLVGFVDTEWKPQLKEAFSFEMKVDDKTKGEAKQQVGAFVRSYIDALNLQLEDKPIQLKTNIDTILQELQTKTKDIKIEGGQVDFKVGEVQLPQQNIGNAMFSIEGGDLAKDDTVRKIYDLLAIRKDGIAHPLDNQIEALRRQIVEKETAERNILNTVETKAKTEQKGAEAVEKKVEAESSKPSKNSETNSVQKIQSTTTNQEKKSENKETTKRKSDNSKSKNAQKTAEEMVADSIKKTREIAQSILKYAKWAKALSSIADNYDYIITEADFGDRDTVKRNGTTYTRQDLKKGKGKIFSRGEKLTSEVFNEFITEYKDSKDKDFKDLYEFFKKLIDTNQESQNRLNELLDNLSSTDMAVKYNESDDKPEYLAKNIKSSFGRLMGKSANKEAQNHLQAVLSKYGVLDTFSGLSSEKDMSAVFKTITDSILGNKDVNIDAMISELSALDGNVSKTYTNFVNLLKIAKEFMITSNSIQTIGQEARKLISGTKEQRDKYKKEVDPRTGRTFYNPNAQPIGVEQKVVEDGLRQIIQRFSAIFIDEFGNRAFGFNDGEGVVDEFLSVGRSTGFTKIVAFLERALETAVDVQVPENKGMTKGYVGLRTHERVGDMKNEKPEYTPGTMPKTEADQYRTWIRNLNTQISNLEKELYVIIENEAEKEQLLGENAQQIAETEKNIIKRLQDKKIRDQARIEEIDAISGSANDVALQKERKELQKSIEQIDKVILDGVVVRVKDITQQISSKIETRGKHEDALKDANDIINPIDAKRELAKARPALEYAEKELQTIKDAFGNEAADVVSEVMEKQGKATGMALFEKIRPQLIDESFVKGEIDKANYIDQLTEKYILMRNATEEADIALAKNDAQARADALEKVTNLEKTVSLLEKVASLEKSDIAPKPIDEPKKTEASEINPQQVDKKEEIAEVEVQKKEEAEKTNETKTQKAYEEAKTTEEKKQLEIVQTQTAETKKWATEERARLAELEAQRAADMPGSNFATVEKQNEIIEILKAGIKVNGKLVTNKAADKSTSENETKDSTPKEKKKKVPKIPDVAKTITQFDEIKALDGINEDWEIYKQYQAKKEQLNNALADAKEKGADFTVEDANNIRAIKNEVISLGNGVIAVTNKFNDLKERSRDAMSGIKLGVTNVKEEMLQLVQDRAIADKSLITDISFDEEKQKMTAVLTDMEGQTTRLTMNYWEMLGAIETSSDKTTDSVRKVYKAIESEMQKFVEVGNLTDDVFGNPDLKKTKEFEKYSDSYKQMLESANKVREKGALATQDEKNELIALRKQVETTRITFEKMVKASNDFDEKTNGNKVVGMSDPRNLEAEMRAYVLSSQEWTASQRRMIEETWKFSESQNSAAYSVEKNKGQLASMSVVADMGTKRIGQFTQETKAYKSGMEKFMDSLKNKWQEVARYLMTFGSMYRVIAVLRQGVTYVKEIDSALTELKKVTDETEESYDRFLKTAAKTADKVGSTIKEIVSSTADWARIGYSLKEATTLAESTAILLNVSEFQSIDEATSALTSTLQAFSYTAEQSMDVVDVLNEVGKIVARR